MLTGASSLDCRTGVHYVLNDLTITIEVVEDSQAGLLLSSLLDLFSVVRLPHTKSSRKNKNFKIKKISYKTFLHIQANYIKLSFSYLISDTVLSKTSTTKKLKSSQHAMYSYNYHILTERIGLNIFS